MNSVEIVNDIRMACLSDNKMTEKERMEIVFGIRPKLKMMNKKLQRLTKACTAFCADSIRSVLTSQKSNPVPVRADSLNICSTSTFRAMSEVKMLLNL